MAKEYPAEANQLRPPLSMLLDHLDYIVKLAGVDHVGIGSDFDGISSSPQQLDDVTSFPIITKELLKRGYKKDAIEKILVAILSGYSKPANNERFLPLHQNNN
jgi:membrane dipeptidase